MDIVLNSEFQKIVRCHFDEVSEYYPELVIEADNDSYKVYGPLAFVAHYNDNALRDRFEVKMLIRPDYPNSIPDVWETGGRIPDFYHKYKDDSLCLGKALNTKIKFDENPTLLWFIDKLLVPYFYSFCHKQITGNLPYGELDHSPRGNLDGYKELFNLTADIQALQMLRLMAEGKYKGHFKCPCGSGKRMRYCHGPELIQVSCYQSQSDFFTEYCLCLMEYIKGGNKLPMLFRSKKLVKFFGPELAGYIFQ